MEQADFKKNWKEIVSGFLKLGATAYGGPAIYGILQAELQEKRQWVSKKRFVEGVSLANLIPGATMTQLCMFLGYARGGFWGSLLAGLCFVLPAFGIMLVLTVIYAHLGATPIMRGGLYGLGPMVLGIFVVAVYRLSRSELSINIAPGDDCAHSGGCGDIQLPWHCVHFTARGWGGDSVLPFAARGRANSRRSDWLSRGCEFWSVGFAVTPRAYCASNRAGTVSGPHRDRYVLFQDWRTNVRGRLNDNRADPRAGG